MFLIVGLGNPGEKFERTRHNVGFWFVDVMSRKTNGRGVIYLKPQQYMNKSGLEVAQAKDYKKIGNENIIVACDDANLPVGRARIRRGGEDGGHNGLKSVIEGIGDDFWRIRIGIGDPGQFPLEDYVLSKPIPEERKIIDCIIDKTATEVIELISQDKLENKTIDAE